ncbi:bifunctional diaminohydroxyphosphoribosylaminopyrimidine deaminase/5-amino-6-(5-phosphoribosylamino)uracil reductase RibD [Verrucomicrobiota bacterium sgz303538]
MPVSDPADEKFMRVAIEEAKRGIGHTSPNPAVGAVIVRDGQILAQGHHRRVGQPHAEIEALRALENPEHARGATIYVTLEPCSTHGRTPPCTDAILRAGLARVVVGAVDPNPNHAGHGLELLRSAGVEVLSGVLADECEALNRPFNKWIVTKTPWVIAKAGMSLDGRLTRPPGEGQWLTSEESRADAMQLRARVDAILVGANTLRADNPRLTIRGVPGFETKQPWRVVVSSGNNPIPSEAHLFTDEHRDRTLVYRGQPLAAILRDLGERQITSVMIEGGMRVLGEAFDHQLVDEVHFYMAPLLCGGPVTAVGGHGAESTAASVLLSQPTYHRIGNDLRLTGLVAYPVLRTQS